MTESEKKLMKAFEAKTRQLIDSYKKMKQEMTELSLRIDQKDADIERLKSDLRQSKSDYDNLKLAKMIEVSDSELKNAKQRITKLVREVNKCIGMLSTEFQS